VAKNLAPIFTKRVLKVGEKQKPLCPVTTAFYNKILSVGTKAGYVLDAGVRFLERTKDSSLFYSVQTGTDLLSNGYWGSFPVGKMTGA
jgi:hypothetical protein